MEIQLLNNCESNTGQNISQKFYKITISEDHAQLTLHSGMSQKQRLKCLLKFQRKYKREAFYSACNILQDLYFPEIKSEKESSIEQCHTKSAFLSMSNHHTMMKPELMAKKPDHFRYDWIMIPCPLGERVRLVASKGITKEYNKTGQLCKSFHSALPGGNQIDPHNCTILDCIYNRERELYFAVDVLWWQDQQFTHFCVDIALKRLTMLTRKIKENVFDLSKQESKINTYIILYILPINCSYDLNILLPQLNIFTSNFALKRILFYHRQGQYAFGTTPLVMWLKPYMLPDVLGISVPSSLKRRTNFKQFLNYILQEYCNSTRVVTNYVKIVKCKSPKKN